MFRQRGSGTLGGKNKLECTSCTESRGAFVGKQLQNHGIIIVITVAVVVVAAAGVFCFFFFFHQGNFKHIFSNM